MDVVNDNTPLSNKLLKILDDLYKYCKSILGNQQATSMNIIMLVNNLIQMVEQYKDITGNQKKMLVLDTIKKIVNETTVSDVEKNQLILLANITLPLVIDAIISAINGDMKFNNEPIIKNTSCFKKYLCLLCCCDNSYGEDTQNTTTTTVLI